MNRYTSTLRADAPPYLAPPRFHPQMPNLQVAQPMIYNAAPTRPLVHPSQLVAQPPVQANMNLPPGMQPIVFGTVPVMPPFVPMLHGQGLPPQVVSAGAGRAYANPQVYGARNCSNPSTHVNSGSSGSGSSGSSARSSPRSHPSSVTSVSSSQGYVAPPTVLYETKPGPGSSHPGASGQGQIPTNVNYKPPKIHPILNIELNPPIRWSIPDDPYYAAYQGVRIPYETFFDHAFKPSRQTIMIIVGLDTDAEMREARKGRIASLEPEMGQRLTSFPVSVFLGVDAGVMFGQPQDTPESQPQLQSASKQQNQTCTESTESANLSEEQSTTITPQYELDFHMVLSGIREGIRHPLPKCSWSDLTIREKLILVKRLSARFSLSPRREQQKRKLTATQLEFFEATVELEQKRPALEREGRAMGLGQVGEALREAHRRLEEYAYAYVNEDGNESELRCICIGDYLGGKMHFKGLRWMNWKTADGIEAYFLCVA